ncbi:MAG: pyruvate kinase [Patescibacteria group bacterium]|nr:pyruvate kinase [Patescibacteria group bacterium]
MEKIKTKIIATIGPASLDFSVFRQLIHEGTDYIRINTAYGDTRQYDLILNNLKNANGQKEVKAILDVKDFAKLDLSLKYNLKIIALSFAENPGQIRKVRKRIKGAFVISKIESEKGVDNFDAILEETDGIMVARGDLGRAVSLEKVPPLQKDFTRKTLEKGKFLITATEMLLSMVGSPQPTRAEVSDVANAVFDHSSAVMLSEETAIGRYPAETVKMMRKIIAEAERWNKL